MQVHYDIENLPEFRNAVITIGTFDGVHMGHRQIIDKLKSAASANNGETVIITFHPHPRKVVSSAILGIRLINTLSERIDLLSQLGVDHLIVVDFTEVFANQSAEEYIKNFLVEKFHPHTMIIGYDHRFGRDRLGNFELLKEFASVFNYQLKEDNVVEQRTLTIVSDRDSDWIVSDGVEAGDKVIVEGLQKIAVGAKVAPEERAEQPAKN